MESMTNKKRFLTALYTGLLIGVLLELKDGTIHITNVIVYCVVYVSTFLLIECLRWLARKYF